MSAGTAIGRRQQTAGSSAGVGVGLQNSPRASETGLQKLKSNAALHGLHPYMSYMPKKRSGDVTPNAASLTPSST
jgi:hypothetical protein